MGWELESKQMPSMQLSPLAHSRLILRMFDIAIDRQETYFKLRLFDSK